MIAAIYPEGNMKIFVLINPTRKVTVEPEENVEGPQTCPIDALHTCMSECNVYFLHEEKYRHNYS